MKKRLGEKREEKINKSEILSLLSILIIVGFLLFVYAAWAVGNYGGVFLANSTVESRGNYSGTILLNCSSGMNITATGPTSPNVTYFYNTSGGAAQNLTDFALTNLTQNLTGIIVNGSYNGTFNITIDTATLLGGLVDGTTYNITCRITNGTTLEVISIPNVTIDNTPPRVNFSGTTSGVVNNGNYSATTGVININVSYGDAIFTNYSTAGANVYINMSNYTMGVALTPQNWTRALNLSTGASGVFFNTTINITDLPDGKYNITIVANDSIYLRNGSINGTINVVTNTNNTERIKITIDSTKPNQPTIANTTSTTTTQISATITVTDAGNVNTSSGIDNCVADSGSGVTITGTGTTSQTLTHTGLTCGTVYNYIITCYDQAGNSNSSTQTSLSTNPCAVSDSGAGGGAGGAAETKTQSWTKITPGVASIMKNFGPEVGVKQIEITVSNEAQNVKITVIKYEGQPAEVTVEKTGKVYGYLQVTTQNLGEKLEKAKMTVQVAKSWASENSVDKENVALFKFDETSSEWNELTTTFTEEDDNYYYYETELTSFSYFAIGEKAVIEEEEEEAPEIGEQIKAALTKKTWLWIVIGVVVLVVIGVLAKKKKK